MMDWQSPATRMKDLSYIVSKWPVAVRYSLMLVLKPNLEDSFESPSLERYTIVTSRPKKRQQSTTST